MAITRVATTNMGAYSGTPETISHAGGNCDAAFVWVTRQATGVGISGVTYGGTAMTELATYGAGSGTVHHFLGLNDCLPGTQDVVVSQPDAKTMHIGIATYRGVSRTATFPDVANTGHTGSPEGVSSVTVSVTTTVDNCMILGLGAHQGLAADEHSAGTDTTRFSLYSNSGTDTGMLEHSPLIGTTAGAYSMQITLGSINQNLTLLVAGIAPNTTSAGVSSPMII